MDFDTMLSVVSSCEVLDEMNRATVGYPRKARPNNASLNMFTLMKGIVPGEQGARSAFWQFAASLKALNDVCTYLKAIFD